MVRVRYHGSIKERHGEGVAVPDRQHYGRYIIFLDNGRMLQNVRKFSFTILGDDDAGNEGQNTDQSGSM